MFIWYLFLCLLLIFNYWSLTIIWFWGCKNFAVSASIYITMKKCFLYIFYLPITWKLLDVSTWDFDHITPIRLYMVIGYFCFDSTYPSSFYSWLTFINIVSRPWKPKNITVTLTMEPYVVTLLRNSFLMYNL